MGKGVLAGDCSAKVEDSSCGPTMLSNRGRSFSKISTESTVILILLWNESDNEPGSFCIGGISMDSSPQDGEQGPIVPPENCISCGLKQPLSCTSSKEMLPSFALIHSSGDRLSLIGIPSRVFNEYIDPVWLTEKPILLIAIIR